MSFNPTLGLKQMIIFPLITIVLREAFSKITYSITENNLVGFPVANHI